MATLEERLTAVEHEYAGIKHDNDELKQKIELHTMAIGAMVNKATIESIKEKNDKIFKTLAAHDKFTNAQLAELREKVEVDIEGKIVGMQTEMRQGFEAVNARFEQQDARFASIDARFEQQDGKLQQILDLLTGRGPQS